MARGGSKGVPRKNIRMLSGKPLLAWTVLEAKKSKYINRIIISTDDEEIAKVAAEYGAEAPFMRPKELAADRTLDLPVMQHALRYLEEKENYKPDAVVQLRPTAPLRRAEHIDFGVKMFLEHPEAHSVRSVTPTPKHPLKMWRLEGERLTPLLTHPEVPEAYNSARQILQDKMPVFAQNGSVDVIRPEVILEMNSMSGQNIFGFVMPAEESVNIDSLEDFAVAEKFMAERLEREK